MAGWNSSSLSLSVGWCVWIWGVVEFCFYFVFRVYIVPRVNRPTTAIPYRDYGTDKQRLLKRILDRIEQMCQLEGTPVRQRLSEFLLDWFHSPPSLLDSTAGPESSSSSSDSTSDTDDDDEDDDNKQDASSFSPRPWTIDGLYQDNMNSFIAWAFFAKEFTDLTVDEVLEHKAIFQYVETRYGLIFPPFNEKSHACLPHKPRRLSLDKCQPLHRPLLVYVLIYILQQVVLNLVLRFWKGFQKGYSSRGLVYWYRPASTTNDRLPFIFFHGIAPGGLTFYLPLLLWGLVLDDRPILLWENPSISCSLRFQADTEDDTVASVYEVLKRHGLHQRDLSVVGHSFGSCAVTWMAQSRQFRIRQIVLLDPVSLLLSEPDTMVNFLYAQEDPIFRLFASSEVFTEYYLRRHFAWYNSELWLEDVADTFVLVGLPEHDEIVHARKIKIELDRCRTERLTLLDWKNAGHAHCVTDPRKWKEIRQAMLQQELLMLQATQS